MVRRQYEGAGKDVVQYCAWGFEGYGAVECCSRFVVRSTSAEREGWNESRLLVARWLVNR